MAIKPKPKKGADIRSETVAGCVTVAVKRAFKALCARVGTTESDAIAQLVERELAEHNTEGANQCTR